ncbi:Lactadherin like protein [Argiope bruennichi]|uniref:Lactadherin like protein n=1 Tax=Argiope bruennichi TaxID=94029 RepID=A0A8T0FZ05_ARGBR|nr:Lactadherin like protein [Argiope bruennichi]
MGVRPILPATRESLVCRKEGCHGMDTSGSRCFRYNNWNDDPRKRRRASVFKGNIDSHSTQTGYLDQNVTARFLRLHVLQWHEHPSMRIEVLGCQDCNSIISVPPQAQLTASSSRPWSKQGTCTPEDAHIFSFGGWCAKTNDMRQWLQIDLGPPTRVTGVVTKGRGDSRRKQWVTSFALSYSNSTNHWHYYKDDNLVSPKEFGGNMDKNTERRHYFNQPFTARYVRVHPMTWRGRVSMRLGLIGCQLKAETCKCNRIFFFHTSGEPCLQKGHLGERQKALLEWRKDGHSSYCRRRRRGHSSATLRDSRQLLRGLSRLDGGSGTEKDRPGSRHHNMARQRSHKRIQRIHLQPRKTDGFRGEQGETGNQYQRLKVRIHFETQQCSLSKNTTLRMSRSPHWKIRVRQSIRSAKVEQAVLGHTVRSKSLLRRLFLIHIVRRHYKEDLVKFWLVDLLSKQLFCEMIRKRNSAFSWLECNL